MKRIIVVRHGQAEHNVDFKALEKANTKLTDKGEAQARAVGPIVDKILDGQAPAVIFTSSVLRAMQTTKGAGLDRDAQGRTPVVVPDLRERISCADHLAEHPVENKDQFPAGATWDWTAADAQRGSLDVGAYRRMLIAEDMTNRGTDDREKWEENKDAVMARGKRVTRMLESRPEQTIVLVSHGAFLMSLTGGSYMQNCEVRKYDVHRGQWSLKEENKLAEHAEPTP